MKLSLKKKQPIHKAITQATTILLIASTLFPVYVPKGSSKAITIFELASSIPLIVLVLPILFAAIWLMSLNKKWSALASAAANALAATAIFIINEQTDTTAITPEPYTSILAVTIFLMVPLSILAVTYRYFKPRKNKIAQETATIAPSQPAKQEQPVFFIISPVKLIILSVLTFGLYEIYWFYKNWQAVKAAGDESVRPFFYALIRVFTSFSLFKKVDGVNHIVAGIVYAVLFIVANAPGNWGYIVSFFSFVVLLYVQSKMKAMGKVEVSTGFSAKEILLAIIGGISTTLITIITLVPIQ